ncbi:unnamed protein product [Polarella glacialis]|uniref:Carrier domain-containing protein n=1 Tax=Polarella glacialis TaxID=89957 RepID=A0A813DZ69_POLGL|nr:unnamed protein product [Polarella glacialis]
MASEAEQQLASAVDLQYRCKTDEALQAAAAALALFRAQGDSRKCSEALRVVIASHLRKADCDKPTEASSCCIKTGEEQLRIYHCEEELKAARDAGDRLAEASMLLRIEINTDKRGTKKREESLAMGLEALAIFREMGEQKLEVAALQHLSNVHIKFCDKGCAGKSGKEVTSYALQALTLSRSLQDRVSEASALHNLAIGRWYSESPFKDGLKAAKEALQIFRDLGYRQTQGAQLYSIADWHQRKGLGKQGLQYAKEALEVFQADGEGKGWECAALGALVAAYIDQDDKESALTVAKEALEKFRASGDKLSEAHGLDLLASVYLYQDDNEEALKMAEESLALVREMGDKRAESYALKSVSQVQMKTESHEDALKSVQAALAIAGELGDTREQAKALDELCRLNLLSRNFKEAIDFAEEAQAVFQKSGDFCGEGVTLLNKSSAHMALGELNLALQVAEDALAMFQQEEDRRNQASAHHFLYEIHTAAQNSEAALRCAINARNLFQKLGSKREEAAMLLRVASAHIAVINGNKNLGRRETKKGCDGALKAAKEAVALAKKQEKEKLFLANAYCLLGQIQGMVGKTKEGLKCGNEALRICEEEGDRKGQAASLITIGEVSSMSGKKEEAKKFATRALELAQKIKDAPSERAALQLLEHLQGGGKQQAQSYAEEVGPGASAPAADSAAAGNAELGPYKGPDVDALIVKVEELAMGLVSVEELHQDSPLMDAGLDSLSMVQFRNTLQQQFPGVPMPASLVFDNPSVRAVSMNIYEELKAAHDAGKPLI